MIDISLVKQIFWTLIQVNIIWSIGFLFLKYFIKKESIISSYRFLTLYQISLVPVTFVAMIRPDNLAVISPIFIIETGTTNILDQPVTYWTIESIILFALLGIIGVSIGIIVKQIVQLIRLQKNNNGAVNQLLEQVKSELNISETVLLIRSTYFQQIFSFSLIKSVIIIPEKFIKLLSKTELKHILQHELIHIKFHDFYINIIQRLVFLLFIYNPVLWLSNRSIDRFREFRCDEYLLRVLNINPKDYAKTLFKVYEFGQRNNLELTMSFIGNENEMKTRIKRILSKSKTKYSRFRKLFSTFLGIFFLVAISCTDYAAKTTEAVGNEAIELNQDKLSFGTVDKKPTIIKKGLIQYPSKAKQEGIEANVVVGLTVNKEGKPVDLEILKGHPDLNEAALEAISQYQFTPGVYKGKVVNVKWQIPIRFRISKNN